MDQFVENWNAFFQDFPITVDTLKNSHGMTQAVLKVFSKLGIDSDAILQASGKRSIIVYLKLHH